MRRRKLGRTSSERKLLLRNQASSLLQHGRIVTTLAKAKALRPFMEKRITRSIRALLAVDTESRLHHIRQLRRDFQSKTEIKHLVHVWARHFKDRPGGYLRIIKLGRRQSDSAEMAMIEFVLETMGDSRRGQVVNMSKKEYQERFQNLIELGGKFPLYSPEQRAEVLCSARPNCTVSIRDEGRRLEAVVSIDPAARARSPQVPMWLNVAFVYEDADYQMERLSVPDYVERFLGEGMESLSFLRFKYREGLEAGKIVAVFLRTDFDDKAHFKVVLKNDFMDLEVARIFPTMSGLRSEEPDEDEVYFAEGPLKAPDKPVK